MTDKALRPELERSAIERGLHVGLAEPPSLLAALAHTRLTNIATVTKSWMRTAQPYRRSCSQT